MYILKYYDGSKDSNNTGIDNYSLRILPEKFSGLVTLNTFDDKILATYQYDNGKYISRGSVHVNNGGKSQDKVNASQICFDVEMEFSIVTPIGTTVGEGTEINNYTETISFCATSHSSGGGTGTGTGSGSGSGGGGGGTGGGSGNPAELEMDLGESYVYFDDWLIEDPCLHVAGLANDDNFR
ncbi:hypothetical protein, partial [Anditalea andensis]|uniref:hypothetical protein n=1 Tax=Anditalea andensis TaxID=1048983 RepID=UPI00054DA455